MPEYQSTNGARKKPGEDRKEGGGDRGARGVGKEQFAPYSPERSKELDDGRVLSRRSSCLLPHALVPDQR